MTLSIPNLIRTGVAFHRKVIFIMLVLLISAEAAMSDDIDDNLPVDTPVVVKASIRQAIQNGMESQSLIAITRTLLQHRFDELQIQTVHALLVDASTVGMPVKPLMNKAHEGMAKNMPPSMIINAMQVVQARNLFAYKQAAMITEQPSQKQVLGQLLTASLAAGLSIKDAGKIIGELQQHDDSRKPEMSYKLALESFQSARDISRLGVSSEAVTGIVAQALSKGYSYEDMQSLRNSFMMQSQHAAPQEIANAFAEAMQAGKGPQDDATSPGGPPGDSGQGGTGSGSGSGGGSGSSGGAGSGSGNSGGGASSSGGNGGSGSGSGGGGGPGSAQ